MASRRIAALAAILLLALGAPAPAQQTLRLTLAPGGVDSGDCRSSPCATPGYAAEQIPQGSFGVISAAPGRYYAKVNVYEFRRVLIEGDCQNPLAVDLVGDPNGDPIIWTQDHATSIVTCLTVEASANNQAFFQGRQFSISDFGFVFLFGPPAGRAGAALSMGDLAVGSCIGDIFLAASVNVYAQADGNSVLNLNCKHHFLTGDIGTLFAAAEGGRIKADQASFEVATSAFSRCHAQPMAAPLGWAATASRRLPASAAVVPA